MNRLILTLSVLGLLALDVVAQPAPIDRRWACEADRIQTGFEAGDHLGHAMAAGDWNGDGFDDVLSGNLDSNVASPAAGIGKAWLFPGNNLNLPSDRC